MNIYVVAVLKHLYNVGNSDFSTIYNFTFFLLVGIMLLNVMK